MSTENNITNKSTKIILIVFLILIVLVAGFFVFQMVSDNEWEQEEVFRASAMSFEEGA